MPDRKPEQRTRGAAGTSRSIRHELRTPLNQIIGYSELLGEEIRDAGLDRFAPDLERIADAGRRLLGMVERLRLSRGGQRPARQDAGGEATAGDTEPDDSAPAPPDDQASPRRPCRILVVDDNVTNRRILGDMLDSFGCRSGHAQTGPAALRALEFAARRGEPFDVVLLDQFEGVSSGDLSASRRYADMYEIISLVESCGLELLLVEGSDAPGARAMRTRVYPTMDTCDAAVPRLRDGAMDMVLVRYEAGAWQHYQSVRFADASPWRVAAETRHRVEQRVADCQVCNALSRGQRDVARTLMLSLLDPHALLDDALSLLQ